MAFLLYCYNCDKNTLHSSRGNCFACLDKEKKERCEKWLKMSDKQKIFNLFTRVTRLEEIIYNLDTSVKF
jgi:hypothetical protein